MSEKVYIHVHLSGRGAACSCVRGDVVITVFTEGYPVADQPQAAEWLRMFLDGLGACLEFEWWDWDECMSALGPGAVANLRRKRLQKLRQIVLGEMQAIQADLAGRTGSPSGRAAGVEPPAPGADEGDSPPVDGFKGV